MDHTQPYSDAYLQGILKSVKTIAMVGASPDKTKFSYGVLRVLNETGYDMIPVNPRPGLEEIRGLKVYPSLAAIDRPVDMVEVFRRPEDLMAVTKDAIAIGAKVLWGQIGVVDHERPSWQKRQGCRL
jgi:predicted CoA-binding protein